MINLFESLLKTRFKSKSLKSRIDCCLRHQSLPIINRILKPSIGIIRLIHFEIDTCDLCFLVGVMMLIKDF